MNEATAGQLEQISPAQVFAEYERGIAHKRSLGKHGMFEQNRINERFFSGDQWEGANCGDSRPLVRYNVIRRIGGRRGARIGGVFGRGGAGYAGAAGAADGLPPGAAPGRKAAGADRR